MKSKWGMKHLFQVILVKTGCHVACVTMIAYLISLKISLLMNVKSSFILKILKNT